MLHVFIYMFLFITCIQSSKLTSPWAAADKDAAMKSVTDGGFPPLDAFKMPQFGTKMLSLFVAKEQLLNSTETSFLDGPKRQVVNTIVSAANNCELCLSFHALGLQAAASKEDIAAMVAGGLPADAELKKIAIAAKYAIAHKGLLLEREKAHLESLGVSKEMYGEVLFFAGQIHANNMLMVYLINEGCDVEDMLKAVGPFAATLYA